MELLELLVISALLVDAVALAAILARISDFGFTPNRVAALGENLILLVNLGWSVPLRLNVTHKSGEGQQILERREAVYERARRKSREQWSAQRRNWPPLAPCGSTDRKLSGSSVAARVIDSHSIDVDTYRVPGRHCPAASTRACTHACTRCWS